MYEREIRFAALGLALAALVIAGPASSASPAPEGTVYSLEQCISIAEKNNPDIAIAGEGYRKAQSSLLANYGNLLPSFSLDFSTGHQFYGPSSVQYDASGRPVQSVGFDYESYSFSLSSDMQLFDGGER